MSGLVDKINSLKLLNEHLEATVLATREEDRDTQAYRDELKREVVEILSSEYPKLRTDAWDRDIEEFFRRNLPPVKITPNN